MLELQPPKDEMRMPPTEKDWLIHGELDAHAGKCF